MSGLVYKQIIRPLLFQLDPEQAHELVHQLARRAKLVWPALAGAWQYEGADLRTEIGGFSCQVPIGLAAGFDKNAHLIDVLKYWGFGFAEIGSVTAKASAGNPKPRLFRLPEDRAIINRMGLNGEGAEVIAQRLKHCAPSLPLGINIAKTNDPGITGDAAIEDILFSFDCLKDIECAFFTINASCPNTKEGRLEEKRE